MALCNSNSPTHFRIQQSQPLLFLRLTIFIFVPYPFANSISFDYEYFLPNDTSIYYQGDAFASNNERIELTNALDTDSFTRVGRALYSDPIHLWDSETGNITDFYTFFSFSITPSDNTSLGDGLTFFLSSYNASIPNNSHGGLLGLFNSTGLRPTNSQIVAIEFDTKQDSWDPCPYHFGFDVNSIASLNYTEMDNRMANGATADVLVLYNSSTKTLNVWLSYDWFQTDQYYHDWHVIDLRNDLPEWVSVGFSASLPTGSTERHTINYWFFNSSYGIFGDDSNSILGNSPSKSDSASFYNSLAALLSNSTSGASPSNLASRGSPSTITTHKKNSRLVVYLPVAIIGSLIFGVGLFFFIMKISQARDQDQALPQTSQRLPKGSSHGMNADTRGGAIGTTNTGGGIDMKGSGTLSVGSTTIIEKAYIVLRSLKR